MDYRLASGLRSPVMPDGMSMLTTVADAFDIPLHQHLETTLKTLAQTRSEQTVLHCRRRRFGSFN